MQNLLRSLRRWAIRLYLFLSAPSGDPATEGAPDRARTDFRGVVHSGRFIAILVVCEALSAAIAAYVTTPSGNTSRENAVVTGISVVVGVVIALVGVFLWALAYAPFRQRDEARAAVAKRENTIEGLEAELAAANAAKADLIRRGAGWRSRMEQRERVQNLEHELHTMIEAYERHRLALLGHPHLSEETLRAFLDDLAAARPDGILAPIDQSWAERFKAAEIDTSNYDGLIASIARKRDVLGQWLNDDAFWTDPIEWGG
jgi:hypothetical protein